MVDFNEVTVEDGENYSSGKELGIGTISLEQFRRCCVEGSREMNRGGTKRRIVEGKLIEIDVPNQREVFINAVDMLHVILIPELSSKYQKELLEEVQGIDRQMKDTEKESLDKYKLWESKLKNNKSAFNEKVDQLNDDLELSKVQISRKKLMVLSLLLKEINYYGEGTGSN